MSSGTFDLTQSADELLRTHPVRKLEELKGQLGRQVDDKKQQLRSLVGSKYRDLLKVADDIVSMETLVKAENDGLVDLAFRKSDYNSKKLRNMAQFRHGMATQNAQAAQKKNRVKVLRNLVHDCIYDFDNLDDKYVPLAKQMFMVDTLFGDELSARREAFSVMKFNRLKEQFLHTIELQLQALGSHEYEHALNLMAAYIIVTGKSLDDALDWFLQVREQAFNRMDVAEQFQDCLSYVFVTLNYVSAFKSRLPTVLRRQIYSSANSNWVEQTALKKWRQWLDLPEEYVVEFPLSKESIQITRTDDDEKKWRQSVQGTIYDRFKEDFDSTTTLDQMASLLGAILSGFKSFTSLTKDSTLLSSLIGLWQTKFQSLLKSTMPGFSGVELTPRKKPTTSGDDTPDLFDQDNAAEDESGIIEQITAFSTGLKTILQSLEGLQKTAANLERPVLSIDDTEDDAFWEKTGKEVKDLVKDSVTFSVDELDESVKDIFNRIDAVEVSDISEYFYLIRILMNLKDRLDLSSIYSASEKLVDVPSSSVLDINELASPLLTKLLLPLTEKLTAEPRGRISQMVEDRSKGGDEPVPEAQSVPEAQLWDEYKGKPLPTVPSMALEDSLYELTSNLLTHDGRDYSDVYLVDEFKSVKNDLITKIIEEVKAKARPTSETSDLLTYADLVFLSYFLDQSDEEDDNDANSVVAASAAPSLGEKFTPELADTEFTGSVLTRIKSHFKSVRLMYYPL